jgi:hypothetical protein
MRVRPRAADSPAAVAAFFALGGYRYLSLDTIKDNRDASCAFTAVAPRAGTRIAFAVYVPRPRSACPAASCSR